MSYRVLITRPAYSQILEQARYIAVDCHAPLNAARWLQRLLEAADTLAQFPRLRNPATFDWRLHIAVHNRRRNSNSLGHRLSARQPIAAAG